MYFFKSQDLQKMYYRSVAPFLILLVTLVALLMGCREKQTLQGEAFIVTEGRDNIKLGLMEVRVYKPDSIKEHLRGRHEQSQKRFKELYPEVIKYIRSFSDADDEFKNLTERDLGGMSLEQLDKHKERLLDATAKLTSLEKASKKAIDELMSVRTQQFYLEGAPKPSFSTKTDSDGKFSIDLWSSKDYYIVARAEREASDSTETYFWMKKLNLEKLKDNEITLGNDNLNGISKNSKAITGRHSDFVRKALIELSSEDVNYERLLYRLSFPEDSTGAIPDSIKKEAPEGYTI